MRLIDADNYTVSELAELPVAELRELFRKYRRAARYLINEDKIAAQLESVAPKTPAEWVVAIRSVKGKCERCNGSGTYYWGASINGRMTHSAPCARCGGKGWVNNGDCRRAYAYDMHAIKRAFA